MNKSEFLNLICQQNFSILINKSASELEELFGKEIALMKGYDQNNPHHCFDLLEHTVRTVENLDFDGICETDKIQLQVAAFLHDVGKPSVAVQKNGKTVFYNHAQKSADFARKYLENIGISGIELEKIIFFIAHHDDFIQFCLPDEKAKKNGRAITLENVYLTVRKIQEKCRKQKLYIPTSDDFLLMLRLCTADAYSQSAEVVVDGEIIDSVEQKIARTERIGVMLERIINAYTECCDLHTHSIASDGKDEPSEIVGIAKKNGVCAVALTDHNTTDGLASFLASSESSDVDAIPGIEISTDYGKKELHIVGLFVSEKHYGKINGILEKQKKAKEESNRLLIKNLKKAGYDVDYDEMIAFAKRDNINRAVIALYLVEKGIIGTVSEGFDYLMKKETGFYVPAEKLSAFQAIKLLRSIGATPVLAHPYHDLTREELEAFLPEAKENGLVAMETNYSEFDEDDQIQLREIATRNGLLFSGGSDYHGTAKPEIAMGKGYGDLYVPLRFYLDILEKRNEKKIKG